MRIVIDKNAFMPTRAHETDAWLNCKCEICGKMFHRKPSAIKKNKHQYCSYACHYKAKEQYMSGEKNHQYGLKGDKNSSWKSDRKLSRYGYIQVRALEHPFRDYADMVFEHRLVAEKYLLNDKNSVLVNGKRYLKKDYDVHHKNFDRTDNRVENLMVLTQKEHRALHSRLNPNKRNKKGQFVEDTPNSIKVKRVTETATIPERKSIDVAGFDLYADISEAIQIKPHETVMVWSGIAFKIPHNYIGAIYARSGMPANLGIRLSDCVSVIDSDYRGNVGLPLHNDSNEDRIIQPQERVAQIIFHKALIVDLELVDKLDDSERGDNGFGSTGR